MKDFNEPIDGIAYGITASLGFATLENLYYVYLLADYLKSRLCSLQLLEPFQQSRSRFIRYSDGLFLYEICLCK